VGGSEDRELGELPLVLERLYYAVRADGDRSQGSLLVDAVDLVERRDGLQPGDRYQDGERHGEGGN
jgi:hypothetical protein